MLAVKEAFLQIDRGLFVPAGFGDPSQDSPQPIGEQSYRPPRSQRLRYAVHRTAVGTFISPVRCRTWGDHQRAAHARALHRAPARPSQAREPRARHWGRERLPHLRHGAPRRHRGPSREGADGCPAPAPPGAHQTVHPRRLLRCRGTQGASSTFLSLCGNRTRAWTNGWRETQARKLVRCGEADGGRNDGMPCSGAAQGTLMLACNAMDESVGAILG